MVTMVLKFGTYTELVLYTPKGGYTVNTKCKKKIKDTVIKI